MKLKNKWKKKAHCKEESFNTDEWLQKREGEMIKETNKFWDACNGKEGRH